VTTALQNESLPTQMTNAHITETAMMTATLSDQDQTLSLVLLEAAMVEAVEAVTMVVAAVTVAVTMAAGALRALRSCLACAMTTLLLKFGNV
jgi:hypothetical protein